MHLELPPELEAIVDEAVRSGRYASVLDAAREAFSLLEAHEAKFQVLKREIEIGCDGPKSALDESFFADVKRRGRERLAELRKSR